MPEPTPHYQLFVGIDIAAKSAAVAWQHLDGSQQRSCTIEQSAAGFARLHRQLQTTAVEPANTLVVLEASGTYWMRLASFLHAANYHVSVINPKQAHDFAKATLRHAKTDALDTGCPNAGGPCGPIAARSLEPTAADIS
jgi:transposase